jgi:hypothetical protein
MSGWWFVLAIVVLAVAGILYLRARKNSDSGRSDIRPQSAVPDRDFTQEREADRVSQMSEEDRTWEAASLQSSQEARERDQSPPGSD